MRRKGSPEVLGPWRMNRSEPDGEGVGPAQAPSDLGHAARPSNNRGDLVCLAFKSSQWQNQNRDPSVLIPDTTVLLTVSTIP